MRNTIESGVIKRFQMIDDELSGKLSDKQW